MPRRVAASSELLEYHESPPAIVRDMEEWLAVGDRRAMAESVRRWLIESYELDVGQAAATSSRKPAKSVPASAPARRARRKPAGAKTKRGPAKPRTK